MSAEPVAPAVSAAPRPEAKLPVRAVNPLSVPLEEPPGPTPWGTGLVISAFVAVFLALADIALCRAFAEAFKWLWIPANLLVGLGLAPSLWLLRRTPLWRWPALGAAVGLAASWVALLLAMLGPPPG
ncbi:MAG TPA: DUF2537 domain-containing protein [Pseudonocardia sp.]